MAPDPHDLITTPAEEAALFEDYALRRVGFTAAWLEESSIEQVLRQVASGAAPPGWPAHVVPSGAVAHLQTLGFTPSQMALVLAHPDTIAAHPRRLLYYMRLTSMSGKVWRRLFPRLARLQATATPQQYLAAEQESELKALNEMLIAVAERSGFGPVDPERLVLCSEGASIDGDWRNQVGRIATWGAMEAMLAALNPTEVVAATAIRAGDNPVSLVGTTLAQRRGLVDERWKPDMIEVDTGYRVRFGPQVVDGVTVDADITIAHLVNGEPVVVEAAGEVKGSSDPANAKDRWRIAAGNIAAMNRIRSGRAARRPVTFYVGLLITESVVEGDSQLTGMRELLDNRTLDAAFSIVKFAQTSEQRRFTRFFRSQIGK